MNHSELNGVIVPAITPVDNNDDVNEAAFRKSLRKLLEAGVHAIFVGGSAGEGPLLVDRQWRRMAKIAFDEIRNDIPLLGGAIDTSTSRVCEKVDALQKIGYRYCVVTPTYYLTVKTPSEHLRLFGRVREAAGSMEMVAYNIPQCTGSTLAVDTICEMARRGWIRYCKESSGDWEYLKMLIQRSKDVGLCVLSGDEPTSGEALLAGSAGIVPVCANCNPRIFVQLYEAGSQGDRNEVTRLMAEILLLRETLLLSGSCWISGIKYSLKVLGIDVGKPVSPLEPASSQQMTVIAQRILSTKINDR